MINNFACCCRRAALHRHLAVHSDYKPYSCPHCDFSCREQSNLQRHIDYHFARRRFTCQLCGAAFHAKKTLETHHTYKHTSERNHVCPICCMAFKTRNSLQRHQRTHQEEREHKCNKCPMAFHRFYNLRRHMSMVHKDEISFPPVRKLAILDEGDQKKKKIKPKPTEKTKTKKSATTTANQHHSDFHPYLVSFRSPPHSFPSWHPQQCNPISRHQTVNQQSSAPTSPITTSQPELASRKSSQFNPLSKNISSQPKISADKFPPTLQQIQSNITMEEKTEPDPLSVLQTSDQSMKQLPSPCNLFSSSMDVSVAAFTEVKVETVDLTLDTNAHSPSCEEQMNSLPIKQNHKSQDSCMIPTINANVPNENRNDQSQHKTSDAKPDIVAQNFSPHLHTRTTEVIGKKAGVDSVEISEDDDSGSGGVVTLTTAEDCEECTDKLAEQNPFCIRDILWSEGPYRAGGFLPDQQLHCVTRQNYALIRPALAT